MRSIHMLFAGVLVMGLVSCTTYRIHLKVIPEDTYNVFLNDKESKGTTDSAGQKDIVLEKVYVAANPKITVKNKVHSGYVVLDAYEPMLGSRYLDSLSVTKGANGERLYNIRFLVDRQMFNEKHFPARVASAPVQKKVAPPSSNPDQDSAEPISNEYGRKAAFSRGLNDNPGYARKIAGTGAACFFVGMGLDLATLFIPVYNNSDSTPNIGGLLASAGVGLTGNIMQIVGVSYAVGGAKLAWELGGGKCEMSKEPFTLWGPYKAGWVFVALGGVFSVISGFVQPNDQSTALTVAVIGLGLQIGRDVCWSITSVKASAMTRNVKECLEEQKMPTHHMRLELNPYATRGGAGLRCSLLL